MSNILTAKQAQYVRAVLGSLVYREELQHPEIAKQIIQKLTKEKKVDGQDR